MTVGGSAIVECVLDRNFDSGTDTAEAAEAVAVLDGGGVYVICASGDDYCIFGHDGIVSTTDNFYCGFKVADWELTYDLNELQLLGTTENDHLYFHYDQWNDLDAHDSSSFSGVMHGSEGNDTMFGSNSSDSYYIDKLYGQTGNDKMCGLDGGDYMRGGDDDDDMWGDADEDDMNGDADDDRLCGGDAIDTVDGGGGHLDQVFGGGGVYDFVYGGPGSADDCESADADGGCEGYTLTACPI